MYRFCPSINKKTSQSISPQKFCFPQYFKNAIVTPLIKKTSFSKEDLKIFWLVSCFSFLFKLVEQIVAAQISSHMDSNDYGNTFQPAYKAGDLTETALCYIQNNIHMSLSKGCIQNKIHMSLSKGMPTAQILFDLSVAFDTIDHDTLLTCLSRRFGFTETVLRW